MTEDLEKLIIDNQNLIYSITHNFTNYPNKDDLFQAGTLGLINAYYRFDPSMGVKFTTYAYPYIVGEMCQLVRKDKGIKVSRNISKLNLMIEKASILLSQQLMREPTISELSNFLEVSEYELYEAIRSNNVIQSIDEAITDDEKELTLHDVISQETEVDVDDLILLRQALENLDDFERDLIVNRYMRDMTQSETSKVLGMSQVQVSRKEQKILMKLKDKLVS
ncbi:MAG: sigma-70 family RNA polymerase sigma factor [Bacilli bacterium]